MSNWERIADALATELRTYREELEGTCEPYNSSVDDALLAYKQAKKRDYIVDVEQSFCSQDGPRVWVAKATHLGWFAGMWPLAIRFQGNVLRNQRPVLQDGELTTMRYDDGFTIVRIRNE
jgi:hypothetical protein